jgi:hypothetical protein
MGISLMTHTPRMPIAVRVCQAATAVSGVAAVVFLFYTFGAVRLSDPERWGEAWFWSSAAALVLGGWALAVSHRRGHERGRRAARNCLVAVVVIFGGGLFCLPVCHLVILNDARQRYQRPLRQIARALIAYAADHGQRLPPAALTGPDGRLLLSWRVVILPYLGEQELHDRFRLDEPWDSPHNRALLDRRPEVYRLPQGPPAGGHDRYYQAFVGPGTAFERPGLSLAHDFPDGPDNTLLVAEARDPVPWSKPADLTYDPAAPLPPLGPDLPGDRWRRWVTRREEVAVTAYAIDAAGGVRHLEARWTEAELRACITRNAGDKLPFSW